MLYLIIFNVLRFCCKWQRIRKSGCILFVSSFIAFTSLVTFNLLIVLWLFPTVCVHSFCYTIDIPKPTCKLNLSNACIFICVLLISYLHLFGENFQSCLVWVVFLYIREECDMVCFKLIWCATFNSQRLSVSIPSFGYLLPVELNRQSSWLQLSSAL